MDSENRSAKWASYVMSFLAAAFMLLDGVMKLFKPAFVVDATTQIGFPESTIVGIGVAALVCTTLYILPRTAVLGAVLLTGYLGGAIAAKVRIGAPLFDLGFALVMAGLIWGGLYLRIERLRTIFPIQRA